MEKIMSNEEIFNTLSNIASEVSDVWDDNDSLINVFKNAIENGTTDVCDLFTVDYDEETNELVAYFNELTEHLHWESIHLTPIVEGKVTDKFKETLEWLISRMNDAIEIADKIYWFNA